MELKTWILTNVEIFGYIEFWIADKPKNEVFDENSAYEEIIQKYSEYKLYSCRAFAKNYFYYLFWDGGICYTVRIKDDLITHTSAFVNMLWGSAAWYERLKDRFGDIFTECACTCLNDKLVTGWCGGKVKGLEICKGLVTGLI